MVDYLLLSEEIYNTRPDLYKNVSHCAKLPYVMPTYNFDCSEKKYFFEEGIHCVYAGRFYKDMRNPEYMLRLFNQLKNDKIKLHLFSVGCEDIVNKFKCGNIILHSQVVNNEIYKVYQEADVLIGIGNNLPEFLPSKTFEYIASCKPILFFNQGTEINNVINEYPLSIQISMSADIQANSEIILNTLPGFKGRSVDIQNINSIYTVNSPEFVKRILLKAIE